MQTMLEIQDEFCERRAEWLLGVPYLNRKRYGDANHFGLFQASSLDEFYIQYTSPLNVDGGQTVLDCISENRKRTENMVVSCLKYLLAAALENPMVAEYLISMPAPAYIHANFMDFVRPYLDSYIQDSMRFNYWGFPREEVGNQTMQLLTSFEEKYAALIPKVRVVSVPVGGNISNNKQSVS